MCNIWEKGIILGGGYIVDMSHNMWMNIYSIYIYLISVLYVACKSTQENNCSLLLWSTIYCPTHTYDYNNILSDERAIIFVENTLCGDVVVAHFQRIRGRYRDLVSCVCELYFGKCIHMPPFYYEQRIQTDTFMMCYSCLYSKVLCMCILFSL